LLFLIRYVARTDANLRTPSTILASSKLAYPITNPAALAAFIENGGYKRHIRRVRRLNAGRRAALLAALTENLGDEITVVGLDAGLHVVVWVNDVPQAEENALAARAQAAGFGLYGISPLYVDARSSNRPNSCTMRFSAATSSPDSSAVYFSERK
jgi:DNA-binding transcriptional MocR family regulator